MSCVWNWSLCGDVDVNGSVLFVIEHHGSGKIVVFAAVTVFVFPELSVNSSELTITRHNAIVMDSICAIYLHVCCYSLFGQKRYEYWNHLCILKIIGSDPQSIRTPQKCMHRKVIYFK